VSQLRFHPESLKRISIEAAEDESFASVKKMMSSFLEAVHSVLPLLSRKSWAVQSTGVTSSGFAHKRIT
jgi:hypothetical protein